jgi:hypothetical protein
MERVKFRDQAFSDKTMLLLGLPGSLGRSFLRWCSIVFLS